MARKLAQIVGVVVLGLALVGLVTPDGRLMEMTNTDFAFDILRLGVAAALLYAGFVAKEADIVRSIVLGVGVMYVGMGVLGLFNSEFFGLLPNGLTGFDITYHLAVGAFSIFVAARSKASHASAV